MKNIPQPYTDPYLLPLGALGCAGDSAVRGSVASTRVRNLRTSIGLVRHETRYGFCDY